MSNLRSIRRQTEGVAESRSHSKYKRATKRHPLVYPETCFAGKSQLTMEQLRAMSSKHTSGDVRLGMGL